MASPSLEPIAEQYCKQHRLQLIGRVGSGAFKQTFHVKDHAGDSLALKVYQDGFSAQRTEREILALQRCSHPNIARLYAVTPFSLNGSAHLVSIEEFLPGGTLGSCLQANGLMDPSQVTALGSTLIDAVSHIASLDLVHRDLKPDNILLRADGITPVVVDFGLVRDLRAESITQTWLLQGPGTPLFAPPEQLRNDKLLIDWRSDQFSLGVLLSYTAFGFHPFENDAESPQIYLERVIDRGSHARRFLDAASAAGLDCLVKMTQPWPVDRYRTPATLVKAWAAQRRAP